MSRCLRLFFTLQENNGDWREVEGIDALYEEFLEHYGEQMSLTADGKGLGGALYMHSCMIGKSCTLSDEEISAVVRGFLSERWTYGLTVAVTLDLW